MVFKALLWLSSVQWIDIRSVYKIASQYSLYRNNVFYILILLTFQITIMLKVLPSSSFFSYCSQFTQSAELHMGWPIKIPGNTKHWRDSQCFLHPRVLKGRSWRKKKFIQLLKIWVRRCSLDPIVLNWNATTFHQKRRLPRIYLTQNQSIYTQRI